MDYSINWKISKYSILAHIYFFFNSLFLPKGLLYTTILSPVFYYRTVKAKRKTYALAFGGFLFLYDLIHFYNGVDFKSFIISNLLFIVTYFCVISFYYFVNSYQRLSKLFREICFQMLCLRLLLPPFFSFLNLTRNGSGILTYLQKASNHSPGLPCLHTKLLIILFYLSRYGIITF